MNKKTTKQIKNLIGQNFGHWVVISLLSRRAKNGGVYYKCVCQKCGRENEVSSTTLISGRTTQCWRCVLEDRKTNTKARCIHGHLIAEWGRTPGYTCRACVKHKSLMREYGITLEEFILIYEFQKGLCAICGRDLGPYVPLQSGWDKGARIEVDHDHRLEGRNSVRGLLCGGRWAGCNHKLGRIDHVEWLKASLEYVSNPPAKLVLASGKQI